MLSIEIKNLWNGQPASVEMQVRLSLTAHVSGLKLSIDAPFYNDPVPKSPPGPCWKLWEHEVVELFIAGSDDRYLEIECGPHGHYLVLMLNGVRSVHKHSMPTSYKVRQVESRWLGELIIPRTWLPKNPHRINAYAIHGIGEDRKYLSWIPLPGKEPDFHQPSQFRPSRLPII